MRELTLGAMVSLLVGVGAAAAGDLVNAETAYEAANPNLFKVFSGGGSSRSEDEPVRSVLDVPVPGISATEWRVVSFCVKGCQIQMMVEGPDGTAGLQDDELGGADADSFYGIDLSYMPAGRYQVTTTVTKCPAKVCEVRTNMYYVR